MTFRFASLGLVSVFTSILAAGPREDFLRLIDRQRVPLAPEAQTLDAPAGFAKQAFQFSSEAGERVPGIALKAKDATGRLPVVIVLHGTGGTKEHQPDLQQNLARRGFLVVAIDGRHHGERSRKGSGSAEYVEAILARYRGGKGFPFLYDTVWDVLRLLDYLETRADADPTRIGAIGFSKGGMELYLAAAVDTRIRAAIPCIGVQSFRWALDHDLWQSRVGTFQSAVDTAAHESGAGEVDAAFVRKFYERVAPGVYTRFDGPIMTPLIAPRPLFVINGDSDARTPMPGLMECINATRAAYQAAGAADAFRFLAQEKTGHKVNPDALREAMEWFSRWLAGSKLQPSAAQ